MVPKYWIANHVCACATQSGVVLLDLKRNRYLGVTRPAADAMVEMVANWPPPQSMAPESAESSASCTALVDELIGADVLTAHPPGARFTSSAVRLDEILSSVGRELRADAPIRAEHLARLLRAWFWAHWSLRRRSLYAIAKEVYARKHRDPGMLEAQDTQRMVELVSIFRLLRPCVFTAGGRCLLHALVLLRFLSYYELFPNWVIGVRTQPWAAHSWLQHGNLTLDCNPEQVFLFTPILVV